MLKAGLRWTGLVLIVGVSTLQAQSPQLPTTSTPSDSLHRATINRYCVSCHSERLKTANLSLEGPDLSRVGEHAEVWEKVLRKVETGAMPPAGAPRPDQATYDALSQHLESSLDRAAEQTPNPGRPPVRRLNRTEYTHAVRDLLGVEIDGAALLPSDDSRYGFDNVGNVLTLSPLLAERYLAAAAKIRRAALGEPGVLPSFEFYNVPAHLIQEDRISEALPFGSRGGVAISHHFPLDGEYVIRVRLQRNSREYIRGLTEAHRLDVRLDGARVQRFTIGGERRGRSAGIFSTASTGDLEQELYERTADEALEVRVPVRAGTRVVGVSFVKETTVPEGPLQPRMTQYDIAQYKGGLPGVLSVAIGGPYDARGLGDTPSRNKILTCKPQSEAEEEPCAREILSTLARRAYRRPVSDADMQTLVGFYRTGRSEGDFETGIGMALERILVGPEFLFLMEREPAGTVPGSVYRLSDLELASRLSLFLWSSIPDGELLEVAEAGRLSEPAVLEQQVRRMLRDTRSKALVDSFAAQWLYLRNLPTAAPDFESFPYFDENLREAFWKETELFFESILREDRSVLDLLGADYTFLNERLARHYGIANIYGSHFRKVQLTEPSRGGLLGQGSILTVTSYANRTSPVTRGKWILENILGTPPPPPPPNVPELRERDNDGKVLSMRQQMERHRANPACAGCHSVMDPLGFALENFDAIGRWRTTDARNPIDASGKLPDGTVFNGPDELRKILLEKRRDQFVATVTERLLTYALGRGVEYYDAPAIRQVMRRAGEDEYRLSSLIVGIAQSVPFQMRRTETP